MVRTIKLLSGEPLRVSGSMKALNDLCSVLMDAYLYNSNTGFDVLAEPLSCASSEIFKVLDERGYYDDVK